MVAHGVNPQKTVDDSADDSADAMRTGNEAHVTLSRIFLLLLIPSAEDEITLAFSAASWKGDFLVKKASASLMVLLNAPSKAPDLDVPGDMLLSFRRSASRVLDA